MSGPYRPLHAEGAVKKTPRVVYLSRDRRAVEVFVDGHVRWIVEKKGLDALGGTTWSGHMIIVGSASGPNAGAEDMTLSLLCAELLDRIAKSGS